MSTAHAPLVQPSLEKNVRTRARRNSLQRALLMTLATAQAFATLRTTRRVFDFIDGKHLATFPLQTSKQRLHETAWRLRKKGLIEFRVQHGRKIMDLTVAGRAEVQRMERFGGTLPRPRRWDGRWRIVVFDIPERRRQLRDRLRDLVRSLGFYRLQQSVWVYPYDCEEIITLLKTELKTGRNVLYIIADAIEYDAPLKTHFKLEGK